MSSFIENFSLPLTNPILIFAVLLSVILLAPILLNKIRVPYIVGLIVAGMILGPHGFNILLRDSSIELFGTVGLLYIMFVAGVEVDIMDFKKNKALGITFGAFTYIIPMILGFLSSLYLLGFNIEASILLASVYASHTLIAYPIVSRYGVAKNKIVSATVVGTVITNVLSLLTFAVVLSMRQGDSSPMYWIGFSLSVVAFGAIVLFVFPIIARWFFKKYSDSVSQYIFVLALLFLSAFLAQLIGIEGIIGAFLAGIALNKLIPSTSALMNRIDFVGNAIFIPIFLIGVGMLVDIKAIFSGYTTLLIALLMSVVATASKFLAAYATQKSFKLTVENRNMIFGLSNAQAAATLAVVIVSHGLGIFGDSILDATIIMILITCLISSFVTEKAARKIVKSEKLKINQRQSSRILIPVSNPNTIERLINLATMMRSTKSQRPIYALYVSDKQSDSSVQQEISKSLLEKATFVAAANDTAVRGINLKDNSIANGIIHTIKQHSITDVVLGFSTANFASALFRMDSEALLKGTSQTIFYSRVLQPINTIKRILVVVAPNAEYEVGFSRWLYRITNLYKQIGAKLVFYADNSTIEKIRFLNNDKRNQYEIQCIEFNKWTDFLILAKEIQEDDLFVTVTARKDSISYNPLMERLPNIFSNYFRDKNILLIYPEQYQSNDEQTLFLSGSPTT